MSVLVDHCNGKRFSDEAVRVITETAYSRNIPVKRMAQSFHEMSRLNALESVCDFYGAEAELDYDNMTVPRLCEAMLPAIEKAVPEARILSRGVMPIDDLMLTCLLGCVLGGAAARALPNGNFLVLFEKAR